MKDIEREIKIILDTIIEKLSPLKIVLFGSYVYGKPTKDSDIDILVVVQDHKLPRYKRAREIRKCLWNKVTIPIPKDILIYTVDEIKKWKGVKEAFITSVLEQGKVAYEKQD